MKNKIKIILSIGGWILAIIGWILFIGTIKSSWYPSHPSDKEIIIKTDTLYRTDTLPVLRFKTQIKYKTRLLKPETIIVQQDTTPITGGIYDILYRNGAVLISYKDTRGNSGFSAFNLPHKYDYFLITFDHKTGENHLRLLSGDFKSKVVLNVYGLVGIHSTGLYVNMSKGWWYIATNLGYSYINRGYFDFQVGIRLKKWEF